METEGFRVLVATDGPSALGSVRRQRPAVVLLSVIVPTAAVRVDDPSGAQMAGSHFGHHLRCQSTVGVIALIQQRDERSKEELPGAGADGLLMWPFNCHQLRARMRAVVRRTHQADSQSAACGLRQDARTARHPSRFFHQLN